MQIDRIKRGIPNRPLATLLFLYLLLSPLLSSAQEPLHPFPIHELRILKIAVPEARAAVKTPDGALHIVKVGDSIGDRGGTVKEIAEGRIVLEEMGDREMETVIIRVENGKQRIERIKRKLEAPPLLFAPKNDFDENRKAESRGGSFSARGK